MVHILNDLIEPLSINMHREIQQCLKVKQRKKYIIYSFVHIIKYSLVRIFDSESESKRIGIGIGMAISRDSAVHCALKLFFLLWQNLKWQNL